VSFEQAYTLYAHPSILLNLGIAHLKTGEPVLAEQDLVKFLSEDSGSPPEELAAARDALAEARGQIGTMRVQVSPQTARVAVDGKAVEIVRREAAGDLVAEARVKAGKHTVAAEAEGYVARSREVAVDGRREVDVTIALDKTSKSGGTPPPALAEAGGTTPARAIVGWSLVGVAGAAAVTSLVTALRAKSLADAYENRDDASHFQDAGTRSTGIAFRTAADVTGGIAIVAAAGAIVLLLTNVGAAGSAETGRESRAAVLRW
jgi:hypothetical protein